MTRISDFSHIAFRPRSQPAPEAEVWRTAEGIDVKSGTNQDLAHRRTAAILACAVEDAVGTGDDSGPYHRARF